MKPSCPAPELVVELGSRHAHEGPLGTTGSIVVGPPPNLGIERCNQIVLCRPAMLMDVFLQLYLLPFLGGFARSDSEGFESLPSEILAHLKLTDGKAEKVKAQVAIMCIERMGDTYLGCLQAETDSR